MTSAYVTRGNKKILFDITKIYINGNTRSNSKHGLTAAQKEELKTLGYGHLFEYDKNTEFVMDLTKDGDVEPNPGPVQASYRGMKN